MSSQFVKAALIKNFEAKYGRKPEVLSYAPGRVEILGNHTDYNEGLVLSAAINFGTFFAAARRDDGTFRLTAGDIMETVECPMAAPQKYGRETQWANYIMGVLAGLNEIKAPARGVDAMFLGDIPMGSGLSSSAALEVAGCLALAKVSDIELDKLAIAKIGQRAEHEYVGVKCGLLDQVSSIFGEQNALVLTDFRSLEVSTVKLPETACFIIFNTNAKHALSDGVYNERRAACEEAAKYFASKLGHKVAALRDVSWEEWQANRDGLDEIVARRAAHPIGEDERVVAGAELLRDGKLTDFGTLMFESHESSRNFFENSCPELDTIVDAAQATPGVLGARLSGGGFGGSVVALTTAEAAAEVAHTLSHAYGRKYGKPCDSREIRCSAGASLVEL